MISSTGLADVRSIMVEDSSVGTRSWADEDDPWKTSPLGLPTGYDQRYFIKPVCNKQRS